MAELPKIIQYRDEMLARHEFSVWSRPTNGQALYRKRNGSNRLFTLDEALALCRGETLSVMRQKATQLKAKR